MNKINIDDIAFRKVKSSIIVKVAYHEEIMYIEFKNWKIYEYYNVPKYEYNNMLEADSVGSYFKKNLSWYKYKEYDDSWSDK